jgi:hypothetical protein
MTTSTRRVGKSRQEWRRVGAEDSLPRVGHPGAEVHAVELGVGRAPGGRVCRHHGGREGVDVHAVVDAGEEEPLAGRGVGHGDGRVLRRSGHAARVERGDDHGGAAIQRVHHDAVCALVVHAHAEDVANAGDGPGAQRVDLAKDEGAAVLDRPVKAEVDRLEKPSKCL